MAGATDDRGPDEPPQPVQVGDIVSGTIVEASRSRGVVVELDGRLATTTATVGPLELSWELRREGSARVGRRVVGEVIAVDLEDARIRLSLAATENPELWAFLKGLQPGDRLSGVVADVQRCGVFVALDDGPAHSVFPGVGFITWPEMSWGRIESISEAVEVGQRVTGVVLYFDTWNLEARLSLRALQPDPLREFAAGAPEGRILRGTVTKLVPFGAFVCVADSVEGLVHLEELADGPVLRPEQAVQVGEEIDVILTHLDLDKRRVSLSCKRAQ